MNSDEGKIYYWPMDGSMNGVTATASHLLNLVRLQGSEKKQEWVKNVEIKGIVFMHCDRMPEDQWPENWVIRNFQNPDSLPTFWLNYHTAVCTSSFLCIMSTNCICATLDDACYGIKSTIPPEILN